VAGVRTIEGGGEAVGWRAATAALHNRQFRWLYISNVAFFFAMNGQFVVRSILAYRLTESATALGLVNLMVAIPMLVLSPFGGVVADRFERRRLIMLGQASLVLNEATVLTLLLTGQLTFTYLLASVFLTGCTFPFIMPARQAIVANIVGRKGMANAMALQMSGMNAARVAGPVVAGTVIAVASIEVMYVAALLLYGCALLGMTRVTRSNPARERTGSTVFSELFEGLNFARRDPPVRALLVLSLVPVLFAMPFQALLVVFAEEVWHTGSGGLGALQAVAGFGGIAGSVYVAWHGSNGYLRRMVLSLGVFAVSLFCFALSPWFALALVLIFVVDVAASVFGTVHGTAVNLVVPDAVRGRVMSLMMMTFGLTPLGTLPVSAAADAWGAPAAIATSAVVMAFVSAAIFVFSRSLRDIDQGERARPGRDAGASAHAAARACAQRGRLIERRLELRGGVEVLLERLVEAVEGVPADVVLRLRELLRRPQV
jgi:MFS family permease